MNAELKERIRNEMIRVMDNFRDQSVYWAQRDDLDMVNMIEADIAYNQSVLDQFLADDDLDALLKGIYRQDTLPREEFWRVFDWVDELKESG